VIVLEERPTIFFNQAEALMETAPWGIERKKVGI